MDSAKLIMAVAGVLLLGCPEPSSTPPRSVGPAGGELDLGAVQLVVPPGAVPERTVLSAHVLEVPDDAGGFARVTPVIELWPPGLQLGRPITVKLDAPEAPEHTLVWWTSADGQTFEVVDAVVESGVATFEVAHLGRGFGDVHLGPAPLEHVEVVEIFSDDPLSSCDQRWAFSPHSLGSDRPAQVQLDYVVAGRGGTAMATLQRYEGAYGGQVGLWLPVRTQPHGAGVPFASETLELEPSTYAMYAVCSDMSSGWFVTEDELGEAVGADPLLETRRHLGSCTDTEGDCLVLTGTTRLDIDYAGTGPNGAEQRLTADLRIPTVGWEVPCDPPGLLVELGVGGLDACAIAEACTGGGDEDGDGSVDCDDPDCGRASACTTD
jgi:hypothetical protein